MHIRQLTIHNFKCFRGEHVLNLAPKIYAITARRVDDVESSNWAGKSTVMETAASFLLYGEHTAATEDAWISSGEKFGEVCAVLDDGTTIKRSRQLGKSTRLLVIPCGAESDTDAYGQEEAQKYIEKRLALAHKDFIATCYFAQKQMARLITAEPGERMKMITAWFRLEPLQAAEDHARQQCARLGDETEKMRNQLGYWRDEDAKARAALGLEEGVSLDSAYIREIEDVIDPGIEAATERVEASQHALEAAQEKWTRNESIFAARGSIAQYDKVVEQGVSGKAKRSKLEPDAELKSRVEVVQAKVRLAVSDVANARKARAEIERTGLGNFDGACPVDPGIECPAKDKINARRKEGQQRFETASSIFEAKRKIEAEVSSELATARERHREALDLDVTLESLRGMARKLAEEAKRARALGEPEARETLQAAVQSAKSQVAEATAVVDALKLRRNEFKNALRHRSSRQKESIDIAAKIVVCEEKLATQREALVVLGRNGAQRRVAEGALAEIEDGANAMLGDIGVALSLKLAWSREGQGPAKICEACGNPFPSSAKVKTCSRCGADRGLLTVHRLGVDLSNRSGAAEDLAGGALQLSASAWLRAERASGWGTVYIDEPFAAMDKSLRLSFARGLLGMLTGKFGFEQGFVISHTADTVALLPGRIEVVSDGKWAKVRVIE